MQMKSSYFLLVRATRLPWDTLTKNKDILLSPCVSGIDCFLLKESVPPECRRQSCAQG